MRLSKADLPGRVNSSLRLRYEAKALTSFAGLELIRRYFRSIDLAGRIRRHLKVLELEEDYGVVSMVLLVLGLLICGGRRLQHLIWRASATRVIALSCPQALQAALQRMMFSIERSQPEIRRAFVLQG